MRPLLLASLLGALLLLLKPWFAGADDDGGVSGCSRWPQGRSLLLGSTLLHPIGISVPSELVLSAVPAKLAEPMHSVAGFAGSRGGGNAKEYRFGPGDEDAYHDWYRRHRFAITRKKGNWDATRHAEIMAAGSIPLFERLAKAPPYVLPFLPVQLLLEAVPPLVPYDDSLEAAYNATVEALLAHTRRCLTNEAMAEHVLTTMGLWPTRKPLSLLYVGCGWGSLGNLTDGWQGPVSIGLFIGLQRLLQRVPGSRVVEAPFTEQTHDKRWGLQVDRDEAPGFLWYTFQKDPPAPPEVELKSRAEMYGFGFSYARRLGAQLRATAEERQNVLHKIYQRGFDAIIYGKVGPTQGCDPLPYLEESIQAGYPAQRMALIYGGDFGPKDPNVARYMKVMASSGHTFVREVDAPQEDLRSVPSSMTPTPCHMEDLWLWFFRTWERRLACWFCDDPHGTVSARIWPQLFAEHRSMGVHNATGRPFGNGAPLRNEEETCWPGSVLLAFAVLEKATDRQKAPLRDACPWFGRRLMEVAKKLREVGLPAAEEDFRETFGVSFAEVRHYICVACGDMVGCRPFPGKLAGLAQPDPLVATALFSPTDRPDLKESLEELRARVRQARAGGLGG